MFGRKIFNFLIIRSSLMLSLIHDQQAYADEEEEPHGPPTDVANEKKLVQIDNGNEMGGTDAAEEAVTKENDERFKKFLGTVELEECPNLGPYLSAKEARQTARENFLKALEECEEGLRKSMLEEMLKDTVVAIHQEQGERFEAHEAEISATMVSNHERRNAMLKRIDKADAEWRKKYKRVRRNIELEEVPEVSILLFVARSKSHSLRQPYSFFYFCHHFCRRMKTKSVMIRNKRRSRTTNQNWKETIKTARNPIGTNSPNTNHHDQIFNVSSMLVRISKVPT